VSVGLLDFFILEASDYVERLDALLASAARHGPESEAFTRLARGLRGSATMAKLPALAELAAALERVGRALHDRSVAWNGALAGEMAAAIDDLKILLHAVRTWGPPEDERARTRLRGIVAVVPAARGSAPTPSTATGGVPSVGWRAGEIASTSAAAGDGSGHPHAAATSGEAEQAPRVVPIAELFHAGTDGVLARAPAPPTTPAARFGTEVVAHAEHLAALLTAAGAAGDAEHREGLVRELRAALRALRDLAESYGEHDVARFAAGLAGPVTSFDAGALATLASGATLLAAAGTPTGERVRRLRELLGEREPEPQPAVAALEPAGPAERPAAPTPTGKQLQALLQNGIAGISLLDHAPMGEAARVPADADADVVPIETLLYRGPTALARAREIRDQLRRIGGPQLPDALVELFDLLDLAAAE